MIKYCCPSLAPKTFISQVIKGLGDISFMKGEPQPRPNISMLEPRACCLSMSYPALSTTKAQPYHRFLRQQAFWCPQGCAVSATGSAFSFVPFATIPMALTHLRGALT